MKALFPYIGAKTPVQDRLAQLLDARPHDTYIELFGGSLAVYYEKKKAAINVLNDADADVIGIHVAVAADPEVVMAERRRLPAGRPTYKEIQSDRGSSRWCELTGAQRAARMMYTFCCAVNAKQDSPFPASATRPINYNPNKDLRPYAEKLRGVTFECLDWSAVVDRYALQPNTISCMLYADPTYVVAQKGKHYGCTLSTIDHLMLARKLSLLNQRNAGERRVGIVVTYDDDEAGLIRSLYRVEFGWHINTLPVKYKSGHHAHATQELLITNFVIGGQT